jgi:NAD-dependent dihydropyrimidine dehydrogenase PreA subunit
LFVIKITVTLLLLQQICFYNNYTMKTQSYIPFIAILLCGTGLLSCTKNQNSSTGQTGAYSVFAWNDLGMHCLNPTYDKLVILPPYNNVLVQVVQRGNPPVIVTSGITVSYKLTNNTTSYNKKAYGGFWDNAMKLFGVNPAHDIGLKGNGLSGDMTVSGDHYVAEGIPVVPVNDNGTWSPFQVAEITVKDNGGLVIAQTQATVPTSDEINCAKCHGSATVNAFDDILSKHDLKHGTNFSAAANKPVLCASCHPSPALGINTGPQKYLSQVLHGSHANKAGITCYDCHPGATTKCNRSLAHTSDNGNCTTCHGDMANVASTIATGRVPWASEPACVTCHTGVTGVSTGTVLYRNSKGHGAIYCSACHGSPHAMYPSREASDNYQSTQYQGFTTKIKTIGSCGVCHTSSRGESGNIGEFGGTHGGSNPEKAIGCGACHTAIPTNTAEWPHAYTWKNSN